MQKSNIWIAITKSRPLPGCEINMDGCEFYFADVFVPFKSSAGVIAIVPVINAVKDALREDKLELADVLLCAQFRPEEWVDQTGPIESLHELANEAIESEAIVFSGFRSEEIQELYHYTHIAHERDE